MCLRESCWILSMLKLHFVKHNVYSDLWLVSALSAFGHALPILNLPHSVVPRKPHTCVGEIWLSPSGRTRHIFSGQHVGTGNFR